MRSTLVRSTPRRVAAAYGVAHLALRTPFYVQNHDALRAWEHWSTGVVLFRSRRTCPGVRGVGLALLQRRSGRRRGSWRHPGCRYHTGSAGGSPPHCVRERRAAARLGAVDDHEVEEAKNLGPFQLKSKYLKFRAPRTFQILGLRGRQRCVLPGPT